MGKKITIFLGLMLSVLCLNNAFADSVNKISAARTTNSAGTSKTVFKWNETPYLLSIFNKNNPTVYETWRFGADAPYNATVINGSGLDLESNNKKILNALPDWSSARKLGTWKWTANLLNGSPADAKSGTFCVVTPEPISTALFLLGSATFGLGAYRKRKSKA